jgi:hypothetical protein
MGFERMQRTMTRTLTCCSVGVLASAAVFCSLESRALAASESGEAEPTTWAEKRAVKLASEAIGTDYWSGHHAVAEKKLREGIQLCMVQKCASAIMARLHRDLGVVYVAGMKKVEDGKDEFSAAFAADANVALTTSMAEMPTVKQAFDEVKGGANKSSADKDPKPEPTPNETAKEPEQKPEEKQAEKAAPAAEEPVKEVNQPPQKEQPKTLKNWLSLAVQEDFVLHSTTQNACGTDSTYKCYDANGTRQPPYDPGSYVAGGNQVGTSGFRPGTLRILAGYDRVIGRRFTAGVRLGAIVQGQATITKGDSAVMAFHGEARGAVWFGSDPFSALLRPYVLLSGGVAETDSKVLVQLQRNDDPRLYSFNAWKRSGKGFLGVGAGLVAAITKRGGPMAEVRYLQFMGPSTSALALQLGYAFGF